MNSNTSIEYQTVEYVIDYDAVKNAVESNVFPVDDPSQRFTILARRYSESGVAQDRNLGVLRPGESMVMQFKLVAGPINVN